MTFRFLSDSIESPVLDVVFVHGLRLFALQSENDWKRKGEVNSFWPTWLQADRPDVRVSVLSYEARAFAANNRSLHIEDLAVSVLNELVDNGIGQNPVVFITHSLGGLVIKEMLLRSKDEINGDSMVADSCRGVVFLATPHFGSSLARIARGLFQNQPNEPLETLTPNNRHIANLAARYLLWLHRRTNIEHLVFYEKRPLGKIFTVVSPRSADPLIPNVQPIEIDADHFDIAKPADRKAEVYVKVKELLDAVISTLSASNSPPAVPAMGAAAVPANYRSIAKAFLREQEAKLFAHMKRKDELQFLQFERELYDHEENANELDLNTVDRNIAEVQAELKWVPGDIRAEVDAEEKEKRDRVAREAKAERANFDALFDDPEWADRLS